MSGCRIFVGNLPGDVRTREVEDIFDRYGRIRDIHIKPPRDERHRNAFAFVEFDDYRDADDAVRKEDGKRFDGQRLQHTQSMLGIVRSSATARLMMPISSN